MVHALGFSCIAITQELIWANYYGRFNPGLVRSLAYLSTFGFGAAGPVAMNVVFDIYGSYRPAFMVVIGYSISFLNDDGSKTQTPALRHR